MNGAFEPLPPPGVDGSISDTGYRTAQLERLVGSSDVALMLSFSGGGKRSAAFAHGVLKGLYETRFTAQRRPPSLLDEVEYISAVSGGSFPAAHFGLHREKHFETFEADFLKRDIEAFIWGIYLLPWNWEWLINPLYGTNDRMAEVYDRIMFQGATYADLAKRGRPLVSINATDINFGTVFAFTQDTFDLLCSDLSAFPLSRAVAASNGFPVLFTPITLTNHVRRCEGRRPGWIDPALRGQSFNRVRYLAEQADRYLDGENTRFVHLMDGGIADNLAMRDVLNQIIRATEDGKVLGGAEFKSMRRVMLISVDGQAAADPSWPRSRTVTGLAQIFSAVSGTQIDSYNFETLVLADQQMKLLRRSLIDARCAAGPVFDGYKCEDVETSVVRLALSAIPDPVERERLQAIRTGLTIPDADVDLLVSYGSKLVRESPEIAALMRELDRAAAPAAGSVPTAQR